jgi:hypothetical protein
MLLATTGHTCPSYPLSYGTLTCLSVLLVTGAQPRLASFLLVHWLLDLALGPRWIIPCFPVMLPRSTATVDSTSCVHLFLYYLS